MEYRDEKVFWLMWKYLLQMRMICNTLSLACSTLGKKRSWLGVVEGVNARLPLLFFLLIKQSKEPSALEVLFASFQLTRVT